MKGETSISSKLDSQMNDARRLVLVILQVHSAVDSKSLPQRRDPLKTM